ncbi:MAG: carbon monoxide dehydrogenase subunit G [Anaerolineae bacterium]|jgi:carbon monoxide dehydrogenase subunit G
MKLEGEYVFNGPREEVWELVRDAEVLSTALPGTQSLNKVGDNEYEGEMNVRIGPVSGVFSGRIVVSDEKAPESYTLTVDGKGAPGFVKGTGHVQLIDQGDGTTLMKYEGDVQLGGKLASVGQRMLDTVSKSMTRQGLETLNKALQARNTAKAEGREVEYTPPSETEFAVAVAKDLAGEIFSPEYRTVWVVVAVAILSMTIGYLLGRRK